MQQYKDYRPTPADPKGYMLDERQDWWVVPVSRTRDSGPTDQSNFEAALAILGGEGKKVEVHRFGHWGPGWFEIIIAHPSLKDKVEGIEKRLEDYPLLDEDDASRREYEDAQESWGNWGAKELREQLVAYADFDEDDDNYSDDVDKFEEAADDDTLWSWWMDNAAYGYETHSDGPSFDVERQFDRISAKAKDALVRELKMKAGLIAHPATSEVGEPLFKHAGLNPRRRGVSKKDFEEYLNELDIPRDDLKSEGGRIPDGAQYGRWLRVNDPIAFNVGYNEYVRESEGRK